MTPAKTAARIDAPPTLVAKIEERTVPMNVRSLAIDVSIAGLTSLTTMEITFENPHDRDLEGEILFPLPEVAALCGYGLDIDDLVEEPPLIEGAETAAPSRVGIVWDASLSRATTDKGPDFAVLRELLGRWGSLEVHLRVLRDRVEDAGTITIVAGEADALLARLRDLPCDGGTGPIPPFGRDCDLHLLFSDGLVNFGSAETPGPERPVYAFCAAPVADRAALRRVAEGSGGALFDPRVTPVGAIADSVVGEAFCFLGVDGEAGEVTEVFPARLRPAPPGRFGVVGRLLSENAEITLLYGRGGRVTDRRVYRLSQSGASTRGVVTRLWAQAKADELAASPDRYAEELLDLGRRFGIVTPNTSLLVLETLSQHLEHDVEPAPSRTRLHAEWLQHRRQTEEDEAERVERKLHEVHAAWRERVEWWERKFEPEPPVEEKAPPAEEEMLGSAGFTAGHVAPEPMMASRMEEEGEMMYDMACSPPPPCSPASAEGAAAPEEAGPSGGIAVKSWDPDTPWLRSLKKAGDDGAYEAYLSVRENHARSPSFYLDCSTHLYRIGRPEHARRVLSNLLELSLDSPALLRVCAYLLATQGEAGPAVEILEDVLRMRPDEPQSHRDLALVLEESEEWRRAAELLWTVVTGEWDGRFPGIETIALMELNRLLCFPRRCWSPSSETLPGEARPGHSFGASQSTSWPFRNESSQLLSSSPSRVGTQYSHSTYSPCSPPVSMESGTPITWRIDSAEENIQRARTVGSLRHSRRAEMARTFFSGRSFPARASRSTSGRGPRSIRRDTDSFSTA